MINSRTLHRGREVRKNIKPLPPPNIVNDEISNASKLSDISNSVGKSISKTRSKSIDIKPLRESLKKTKMVFKKLPVKIEDIKNILNIPFRKIATGFKWNSLVTGKTFPSWQPKVQIDYFLSQSLSSADIQSTIHAHAGMSDHLAVQIEVATPK